jgi:hypothetical protein
MQNRVPISGEKTRELGSMLWNGFSDQKIWHCCNWILVKFVGRTFVRKLFCPKTILSENYFVRKLFCPKTILSENATHLVKKWHNDSDSLFREEIVQKEFITLTSGRLVTANMRLWKSYIFSVVRPNSNTICMNHMHRLVTFVKIIFFSSPFSKIGFLNLKQLLISRDLFL